MNDHKIEQAIAGLIEVADSNFPSKTDIILTAEGHNRATIRIPSLALRGMLALAQEARKAKEAARAAGQH